MDKVIVTVLLIVAGVAASAVLVNAVYPAISRSEGAMVSVTDTVNDRMKSQIKIIQAANEGSDIYAWVKNVGIAEIGNIEGSDIFFGPEGNLARVAYGSSGPPYPYWGYQIEGGSGGWKPTVTIKITIHMESPPSSGTYLVKMVIPSGISDERSFGV